MDEFYEAFGGRLRDARKSAGLSQSDLADRVQLSRTSITNIETGKQHPSLYLAHLLAIEVQVSLNVLMDESIESEKKAGTLRPTIERSLENYPDSSREWFKSIVLSVDDES